MARLGDICTFQSGGTPSKTVPAYYQGNIPWITTVSLTGGRISNEAAIEYITDQAIRESAAKIVPQNSIMVGTRVGVGKVAINTVPMSTSQDIISLLNIDERTWDKDFLCKFIAAKSAYLNSQARGATIKGIKIETLASLDLPEITLEEQKHISRVIDEVLQLVKYRKDQLNELDQLVKSRFIELFGDPVENPKGLPVKALKRLSVLITNGNTPKGGSENYVPNGILFIRSQNVWRNRIDLDDVAYIDEKTHRSLRKSSLKHKDILITKTGSINTENSSLGRAALYLGEDDSANINGHVYLVRLDGSVVPEYVISILTSEAYRKYIRKVCVGGIDMRQINLDQVEEFPIILPPVKDQTEFAAFVEQTDKLKLAVTEALAELETLKKSLMQQYFG